MSSRSWIIAAAALGAIGMSAAIACGPFFPIQLLDDRAGTLKTAPVNSFAFEAGRLVTPSDDLKAVEAPYDWLQSDDQLPKQRATAEAQSLSPAQARLLVAMRRTPNGDLAIKTGAAMPAAVRLYTAGAVDFAHERQAAAAVRFESVLALPDDDGAARAVWAAYMLGRLRRLDGDVAGAADRFRLVRTLARRGMPDPLGLAVASYGEEAGLHLAAAKNLPSSDPALRRELAAAVALYAEQAARGSDSGIQSLRLVAEHVMGDDTRLAVAVTDPLTQRLLIVYALARAQDPEMNLSYDDNAAYNPRPIDGKPPDDSRLVALVDAIDRSAAPPVDGADRLAVLVYEIGRYDLAERLADKTSGPLASWIKAKLALQKGDLSSAAARYAEATRALPVTAGTGALDDANVRLLIGERGTLALARGEILDALYYLFRARYLGDVAHLADRILTTDELKRFVDDTPKAPADSPTPLIDDSTAQWSAADMTSRLRNLLARRLVRDGRFTEAATYFKDPEIAAAATEYAHALGDATRRWSGIARARGWYQAASLARESGMELMGFEGAPDFAYWHGELDDGLGQQKLEGTLITADERARFARTAPTPDRRFRYRYIAVDQALRSAALLPPRSQAFAAVLCRATGWMLGTSGADDTAAALYRLYLARGAALPWAAHFGRDCPDPDFAGAERLLWTEPLAQLRHGARRHAGWIGAGLAAAAAGLGWAAWRRRRNRHTPFLG
jgi:hypothetical protein